MCIWLDSLRETADTSHENKMQYRQAECQLTERRTVADAKAGTKEELDGVRESTSVLRGNVVSDADANVGTSLRPAAQEELRSQGVQGKF